jgi:hypothetical protein
MAGAFKVNKNKLISFFKKGRTITFKKKLIPKKDRQRTEKEETFKNIQLYWETLRDFEESLAKKLIVFVNSGRPDWAIFCLLGDCFLWVIF